MSEQKTVKFGPLGRGALPYAFNYQNVVLEKSNKGTPCQAKLHCIVNPEKLVIPTGSIVSVFKAEDKSIYVNASSEESKLDFTCNIDHNTYIQTYRLNGVILFQCRHDPESMEIHYTNMDPVLSTWTFYDH
jgi:hypothetical protein